MQEQIQDHAYTKYMFINIWSTYWSHQCYWLPWLVSCGQTRANKFFKRNLKLGNTTCRCISLTPNFGRQIFHNQLAGGGSASRKAFLSSAQVQGWFSCQESNVKSIKKNKNLLSAVIQGAVKSGETTGIPPNVKHNPGDLIHSFLQCLAHPTSLSP